MTEQYNQNVINLALASSSITADSSTDSPLQLPAGNSAVTVDSTRTTALNIDSAPAASNAGAIVSISVDAAATGAVTFREIDASGAVVSTTAVAAGSNVSFVSDGSSWSIPSSNASLTASATGELPLSDASLVNVDITSAGAAIDLTLPASYEGKTVIVSKSAGEDGSTVVFNALSVSLTPGTAEDVIFVGANNLFLLTTTPGTP